MLQAQQNPASLASPILVKRRVRFAPLPRRM